MSHFENFNPLHPGVWLTFLAIEILVEAVGWVLGAKRRGPLQIVSAVNLVSVRRYDEPTG